MPKSIEFERTFLLREIPKGIHDSKHIEIVDLYVPESSEHPVIRIRKIGGRMEITKKQPISGNDSSTQHEHTIELTEKEFEALSRIPAKEIRKTRYLYRVAGAVAEIDIFHGALEGLALVDFEFKDRESMEKFRPPDFCLAEVTQETFSAGGMLCGKSYSDLERELAEFGYARISADDAASLRT